MENNIPELEKLEINAFQTKDRSSVLLGVFEKGFICGWKMAVPEAFKDALDIKETPIVIKKKAHKEWTQGRQFSFRAGDTLYDTKDAYRVWKNALPKIKICVEIISANSSTFVSKKIETTGESVKYTENNKEKEASQISIKKIRLNPGEVVFKVLCPNREKTKLEEKEIIQTNQDDFVYFLQSGRVRLPSKATVDLFEKHYE